MLVPGGETFPQTASALPRIQKSAPSSPPLGLGRCRHFRAHPAIQTNVKRDLSTSSACCSCCRSHDTRVFDPNPLKRDQAEVSP
jgi:hypothetical protein